MFFSPVAIVLRLRLTPLSPPLRLLSVVFAVFQARNIQTGELAAVKIIKLEPGESSCLQNNRLF